MRPGLSPHAPYSFRFDRLVDIARFNLPVAIHFAESLDEIDLIAEHDGEFVPFLEELGVWDTTGLPVLDGGEHPLAGAKNLLLIHGNYLPADASIPANATVVYCPRTHAAFGHPPHPFREWLKHGVNVALGTDSLATNPDLSILNEARFVFAAHPDLEPQTLLSMITKMGASALGFGDECGVIAPGFATDLCVVGLAGLVTDPLQAVFAGNGPVRAVFADGWRVI
ncbi:MAG: amidohydrolase family protein [Gemmataceae bacterium]